ncbi:MAG: serine hydrolase [Planctomycetes bacterium]|nr:serine hydrolase [Planctomycetota bacterium]
MARDLFSVLLRIALCLTLLLPTLTAQVERESTQPIDTIWQPNVSATTIGNHIAQGYRITDLEIYDPASPRFSVTLVQNSGSYHVTGWWWYYNVTSTELRSYLAQNQARPIDVESYLDSSGTRRFAVVMVSNTGAATKDWTLFLGSSGTTIGNFLGANGYRIVDVDGYTSGSARVYAAIAIRNAGADLRSWWWYLGISRAQVSTFLNQNNARLVDLDPVGDGTYDVVMNQSSGVWGYYFDQSSSSLTQLVNQYGRRIVDIERVTSSTFDVILNNNLDGRGTRISQILNNGTTGYLGAYLRRLDGTTSTELVKLNEGIRFEPASTLKTLPHAYAMYLCSIGATSLAANGSVPLGTTGSCPNGGPPVVTDTLETSLRHMMENSDNARTKALVDTFGVAALNDHASTVLSMPRTRINHVFGCGGPTENTTTLEDLGALHDYMADGNLPNFRAPFHELMINSRTYPRVGTLDIEAIITAEAASEGVSGAVLEAFRGNITYAAKGGNYDWPSVPRYHGSYFGYISIPFVIAGRVVWQQYAVGTFFNDAIDKTVNFNAITAAYCEMLREELRFALRTWVGAVIGSNTVFGTACAGSTGTPTTTVNGTPGIGGTVSYTTSGGPASMPAVFNLGTSRTNWAGFSLPLELGFIGAQGCRLLTDPMIGIPMTTNSQGRVFAILPMPVDVGALGQEFHVQFLLLDPPANALGLVTTRGVTTRVGIML